MKAKTDIVVRLRRRGDWLSKQAAVEIERLRGDLADALEAFKRARRGILSIKTKRGMARARREAWLGKRFGGANVESERQATAAREFAESLRPLFAELAGKSARQIAVELNKRNVPTAQGGRWHSVTVLRVRKRLERLAANQ